ncbi:MAG: hypothetical protein GXX96_18490 [Planctomycetaceae bacterium]|nr:hypothetical protein [Planctomycetaceae bacterium]
MTFRDERLNTATGKTARSHPLVSPDGDTFCTTQGLPVRPSSGQNRAVPAPQPSSLFPFSLPRHLQIISGVFARPVVRPAGSDASFGAALDMTVLLR